MKNRIVCALLAVLLVLVSVSCGEGEKGLDGGGFRVVTSFYPVYVAAANITDGVPGVTLENLTEKQSGCLHDYALTTEDLKKLNRADLFIVSGLHMESFLEKAVSGLPELSVLDCSGEIEAIKGSDGEVNPHYWMNIENAVLQCRAIEERLCEEDPSNAQLYRENAQVYEQKLRKLYDEAKVRCAPLKGKKMVVFHESFDYFALEFGFEIVSVISNHDGSAPSPKKLADTVEFMKKNGIRSVFGEAQFDTRAAETVAKEAGGAVYILDCVTSASTGEDAKNAYIDAALRNIAVLEEALG